MDLYSSEIHKAVGVVSADFFFFGFRATLFALIRFRFGRPRSVINRAKFASCLGGALLRPAAPGLAICIFTSFSSEALLEFYQIFCCGAGVGRDGGNSFKFSFKWKVLIIN